MTQIVQSPEIWHRDDFPILCVWRRLKRVAEIGLDRAEFAQMFLRRWSDWGDLYLGIDPYESYNDMPWSRDGDFRIACERLSQYGRIAKIVPDTSAGVAATIARIMSRTDRDSVNALYGSQFDFVYIDGDHSRDAVARDITTWWPLVSSHGILAGHDWHVSSGDHPGVRAAVEEFAGENGLVVYHTYLDDPQSWYIYKSGKPDREGERKP